MASGDALAFREFLESDTVDVCTTGSPGSLKTHQKLLAAKCKAPMAALTHGFTDSLNGHKGDYLDLTPASTIKASQPKQPKSSSEPTGSDDKDMRAHTLICHLRLYIFSDAYLVSELKQLAFEKSTAVLTDMERPRNIDEQLAVIDCLSLAFSRVPPNDRLLEWLAHYATWCLDKLRSQSKFHDLLQKLPALGSRMMDTLNPSSEAPWRAKQRKYRVPSYDTRAELDYEY